MLSMQVCCTTWGSSVISNLAKASVNAPGLLSHTGNGACTAAKDRKASMLGTTAENGICVCGTGIATKANRQAMAAAKDRTGSLLGKKAEHDIFFVD